MRSGSWLLADLCQQTGQLGWPEEYFRPDFRHHWSGEWGLDMKRSYAEYITSAVGLTSSPNGVFGVKMHAYQMNWFCRQLGVIWGADAEAAEVDVLHRWLPDPHFVHLKRLDVARQAISYYRAVRSRVWFEVQDVPRPTHGPSRDAESEEPDWGEVRYLENGLTNQEALWTAFFERNGLEPFELIYEEFAEDPQRAVTEILDQLGLECPEELLPRPRLKKQADETSELWLDDYLRHRDGVVPVAPGAGAPDNGRRDGTDRVSRRTRGGTGAPIVYSDKGPRPPAPTPREYSDGRASWAQVVAGLVTAGLPIGAAAGLVDALPGEGAAVRRRTDNVDWRNGLTPLPAQST